MGKNGTGRFERRRAGAGNGSLDLGQYVGSLRAGVRLWHEVRQFVMLADSQAMTDNAGRHEYFAGNVVEVAHDYLAVGINPDKSTIFIQLLNEHPQAILAPIREERKCLETDRGEILTIPRRNTEQARDTAARTLSEVKAALGLNYFS